MRTYYDVRLDEHQVQAMKSVARRKAHLEGLDRYSWVDVLRRGVELVLAKEAVPFTSTTDAPARRVN
jgi:hypothetical protein